MTHRRNWTDEQRERYGGGNDARDRAGCIATLSDGQVVHVSGKAQDSLRTIASYCDRFGLQVVTVSTPRTILADLEGRNTYYNRLGRITGSSTTEQVLLGKIGRMDLCARQPLSGAR